MTKGGDLTVIPAKAAILSADYFFQLTWAF
jgi:hypothetical protein